VDTAALGPHSAEKYASAPSETLVAFARKGVEALMSRIQRSAPSNMATGIRMAAEQLGLTDDRAIGLHQALHIATFTSESLPSPAAMTSVQLPHAKQFVSVLLGQDPVILRSGERALTLRLDYKGELAAVLPGHPAATLHDLLVVRVPGLSLLLVRQGTWLAAAALPDAPPPSDPTEHMLPGTLEHKSPGYNLSHTMHAPFESDN